MATRRSSKIQKIQGKYARKCGCLNHELFCPEDSKCSLLLGSSIRRRASYTALLSRGLITARIKHICTHCLKQSQEHFIQNQTLESSFNETIDITNNGNEELLEDTFNVTYESIDPSVDEVTPSSIETDNQNNDIGTHISFDGVQSFLESLGTWDALDKSTRQTM
ncbi:unnamed protein product [Mytilus coruscus]|uniref:Uncharacterized protein n=1 Tax=Mytilus coruscus TaxID=42192 RepID=A0A6J7ZYL6_MYTCO|nr:unnamed protein product [Mytilus coruscus]